MKVVMSIEGWLSFEEAVNLYKLAQRCNDGCIVEVGSYRGKSTLALGLGALAGYKVNVYAVDPHQVFTGAYGAAFGPDDRRAFMYNLAGSDAYHVVHLVNLRSEIISPGWKEPVSLLWIDGDHSYEGVKRDWYCWLPHLSDKATVVFDDALDQNLGPSRLLQEILDSDQGWHIASVIGKTVTITSAGKIHF